MKLRWVLVVVAVLAVLAVMVGAADAVTNCEMADFYGGRSKYYNLLCYWDWLVGWVV